LFDTDTIVDPKDNPDVTNTQLFPQHKVVPATRVGGELIIPIENKHFPLEKLMPDYDDIQRYSKIQSLWFYCNVFQIDYTDTDPQEEI